MTSLEALTILSKAICGDEKSLKEANDHYYTIFLKISQELEILECFRKIPKQDLREFIEWQLRYEKMIKNWLDERPFLYVDKEDPTKHLIKIKEWLDEEEKEERMENE